MHQHVADATLGDKTARATPEVAGEHMVDRAATTQWVRGDRVICP